MSFQIKLLYLILIAIFPFCVCAETVSKSIYGMQLNIPVPVGFARCDTNTPQGQFVLKMTQSSGNQNLACLVSIKDLDPNTQQTHPQLTEYGLAHIQKGLEAQNMSALDFASLKAEMHKQVPVGSQQLLPKEGGKLTKEFLNNLSPEVAAKLKFAERNQIILEIIDTSPRLISVVFLQKSMVAQEDKLKETSLIGVMSTVRIKERVIHTFMYRVLQSKDDLSELRQHALEWANQIIVANV